MESGRLSDGKTLCPRSAALDAVTGVLQDGERFFKVFFLQEGFLLIRASGKAEGLIRVHAGIVFHLADGEDLPDWFDGQFAVFHFGHSFPFFMPLHVYSHAFTCVVPIQMVSDK